MTEDGSLDNCPVLFIAFEVSGVGHCHKTAYLARRTTGLTQYGPSYIIMFPQLTDLQQVLRKEYLKVKCTVISFDK